MKRLMVVLITVGVVLVACSDGEDAADPAATEPLGGTAVATLTGVGSPTGGETPQPGTDLPATASQSGKTPEPTDLPTPADIQRSYDQGYSAGYDEGYAVGVEESAGEGYESGYDDGYQEGHDIGLSDGCVELGESLIDEGVIENYTCP